MDKRFRAVFDKIQAGEGLTHKTAVFLHAEAHKRKGRTVDPRLVSVCVILLAFVGLVSLIQYFTPGAYVDMDVNPSLSLTVNRFGRVLEASAYNADGEEILRTFDVRHMMYADASGALLDAMIERGYLAADGLVSVTVRAEGGLSEQEMLDGLRETVAVSLASHHVDADSELFAVSREVGREAAEQNISPAKYIAITQLQEVDESATFEGCMHHSIHELRRMTRAHSHENSGTNTENGEALEDSECMDGNHRGRGGMCRH